MLTKKTYILSKVLRHICKMKHNKHCLLSPSSSQRPLLVWVRMIVVVVVGGGVVRTLEKEDQWKSFSEFNNEGHKVLVWLWKCGKGKLDNHSYFCHLMLRTRMIKIEKGTWCTKMSMTFAWVLKKKHKNKQY